MVTCTSQPSARDLTVKARRRRLSAHGNGSIEIEWGRESRAFESRGSSLDRMRVLSADVEVVNVDAPRGNDRWSTACRTDAGATDNFDHDLSAIP